MTWLASRRYPGAPEKHAPRIANLQPEFTGHFLGVPSIYLELPSMELNRTSKRRFEYADIEAIRQLMAQHGMKQAAVARRSGLSAAALKQILNDPTHRCQPSTLASIAQALGVAKDKITRSKHPRPRVLHAYPEILQSNLCLVTSAKNILCASGSRSRDGQYLTAIEEVLEQNPTLVHYRVLFGPPHRPAFKEHLLRLLEIRDPRDRRSGSQTLYLGLYDDYLHQSEFSICVNDSSALVVLPSFTEIGRYDTAVLFDDTASACGLQSFVKDLYKASRKLETRQDVLGLDILRQ